MGRPNITAGFAEPRGSLTFIRYDSIANSGPRNNMNVKR